MSLDAGVPVSRGRVSDPSVTVEDSLGRQVVVSFPFLFDRLPRPGLPLRGARTRHGRGDAQVWDLRRYRGSVPRGILHSSNLCRRPIGTCGVTWTSCRSPVPPYSLPLPSSCNRVLPTLTVVSRTGPYSRLYYRTLCLDVSSVRFVRTVVVTDLYRLLSLSPPSTRGFPRSCPDYPS